MSVGRGPATRRSSRCARARLDALALGGIARARVEVGDRRVDQCFGHQEHVGGPRARVSRERVERILGEHLLDDRLLLGSVEGWRYSDGSAGPTVPPPVVGIAAGGAAPEPTAAEEPTEEATEEAEKLIKRKSKDYS